MMGPLSYHLCCDVGTLFECYVLCDSVSVNQAFYKTLHSGIVHKKGKLRSRVGI